MSRLGKNLIFLNLVSIISSKVFNNIDIEIGQEYEYEIDETKGIESSR